MAIYEDAGHERKLAIPIPLISPSKKTLARETHAKSEAPTRLRSPTSSERDRHHARSLPPFLPVCSSRQRLSSVPCRRASTGIWIEIIEPQRNYARHVA